MEKQNRKLLKKVENHEPISCFILLQQQSMRFEREKNSYLIDKFDVNGTTHTIVIYSIE